MGPAVPWDDRSRGATGRAVRTAERDRVWQLCADLMPMSDLQGNMRSFNPAWSAVLGCTPTGLLARNFFVFLHPQDQKKMQAQMARLAEGCTKCY